MYMSHHKLHVTSKPNDQKNKSTHKHTRLKCSKQNSINKAIIIAIMDKYESTYIFFFDAWDTDIFDVLFVLPDRRFEDIF